MSDPADPGPAEPAAGAAGPTGAEDSVGADGTPRRTVAWAAGIGVVVLLLLLAGLGVWRLRGSNDTASVGTTGTTSAATAPRPTVPSSGTAAPGTTEAPPTSVVAPSSTTAAPTSTAVPTVPPSTVLPTSSTSTIASTTTTVATQGTIQGHIEGAPAVGFPVQIWSGDTLVAQATVELSGDFHTMVPPGTYTGTLRFTLGGICTGGPVTVTAGATVTLTLTCHPF